MRRIDIGDGLQPGQRVWVLDPDATGGKAWGTISKVDYGTGLFSGDDRSFVIVLDGGTSVLTCSEGHRGARWDLAPLDVPAPALDTGSPTPSTSDA